MTDATTFEITPEGLEALETAEVVPDEPEMDACDGGAATCEGGFVPDTAEKVDWVLGKIADAKARAARIRAHAEVMAKQAEAEAAYFEFRYGAALQEFARRELAGGNGKRKSLTLYHGVIGFRSRPATFQFDEAAALSWAQKHLPESLAYKVDKRALSEALRVTEAGLVIAEATGEVVTFAAYAPAEEQFYIR